MALSPATIRQRVSTAASGVSGWHVSRWAGENIDLETDERLHKCCAAEVTTKAKRPWGTAPKRRFTATVPGGRKAVPSG